jgi:hypothetical protein
MSLIKKRPAGFFSSVHRPFGDLLEMTIECRSDPLIANTSTEHAQALDQRPVRHQWIAPTKTGAPLAETPSPATDRGHVRQKTGADSQNSAAA